MKTYFVYIMASESGTLYIGVTNDLERRYWQHRNEVFEGFSKKYKCNKLVYYEDTTDVNSAIAREKQLKNWRRDKKEWLIRKMNPGWLDLLVERDSSISSALGGLQSE